MEVVSWWELLLIGIQLGYSWIIKQSGKIKTGWIPVINFVVAFLTFLVTDVSHGVAFETALLKALYGGLVTTIGSTGIHSALKNGTQILKTNGG